MERITTHHTHVIQADATNPPVDNLNLGGGGLVSPPNENSSSLVETEKQFSLSSRQQEILTYVAQGLTNKKISKTLSSANAASIRTVIRERSEDILPKLREHETLGAVMKGLELGIIPIDQILTPEKRSELLTTDKNKKLNKLQEAIFKTMVQLRTGSSKEIMAAMKITKKQFDYHKTSAIDKLGALNLINAAAIYYANQLYPDGYVSFYPKTKEDVTAHLNCMFGTNGQPGIGIIVAKRNKLNGNIWELTDVKILTSAASWEELSKKIPDKQLQSFIADIYYNDNEPFNDASGLRFFLINSLTPIHRVTTLNVFTALAIRKLQERYRQSNKTELKLPEVAEERVKEALR